MTSVLFLGNSHLTALKRAWEAAPPQGWRADFFGAPQRAWARMRLLPDGRFGLEDGADAEFKRQRQITQEANGKVAVPLSGYSHIVLVGGFSAAEPLAEVLADCDIADLRHTGAPTLLSQDLFAAICLTLAQSALPEAGWRQRPDAKVALMPRPAYAETCLASSHATYAPWHRIAATPTSEALTAFAALDTALSAVLGEHGLSYLPQPLATRTAQGLTQARFLAAGGGVQDGQPQRRGDHAHMNQDYGTACLPALIGWLEQGSPTHGKG